MVSLSGNVLSAHLAFTTSIPAFLARKYHLPTTGGRPRESNRPLDSSRNPMTAMRDATGSRTHRSRNVECPIVSPRIVSSSAVVIFVLTLGVLIDRHIDPAVLSET